MGKNKHLNDYTINIPISAEDSLKYAPTALALILKKNGYNRPCTSKIALSTRMLTDSSFKTNWNATKRFVSAPLLQDVCDWITDFYEIFVQVLWIKPQNQEGYFAWIIYDTQKSTNDDDSILLTGRCAYESRHEAMASALQALFEEFGDFFDSSLIEDEIKSEKEKEQKEVIVLPQKEYSKVEIM